MRRENGSRIQAANVLRAVGLIQLVSRVAQTRRGLALL